jgi:hypothetical protein
MCIILEHAKSFYSSNLIPFANKMFVVWVVIEMFKITSEFFPILIVQFLNPRIIF